MQTLIKIVGEIRRFRAEWNVNHQEKIDLTLSLSGSGDLFQDFFKENLSGNLSLIKKFANLQNINFEDSPPLGGGAAPKVVVVIVDDLKLYIPFPGDVEEAKKKLELEKQQKESAFQAVKDRLKNPHFTQKAPIDVVKKEKIKMTSLRMDIAELEKRITNLS